jgi:glycine betaine/proline transport system permease protein
VLAAFIGAQGLGYQVWKAIKQLDNGFSIEAGLCILFMAIMFDRFSAAFNNMNSSPLPKDQVKFHLLPQAWDIYSIPRLIEKFIDLIFTCVGRFFSGLVFLLGSLIERVLSLIDINLAKRVSAKLNTYVFFFSSLIILISVYICDIYILEIGEFPKDLRLSIRSPIDAGVDWLATNSSVVAFTKSVRIIIYFYLLNPLDYYFSHLPWWFLMAALMLISYAAVGVRFAIICGILLTFIGFCNIWQESMITLSSVIVSVIICFIIGVPLGIFAAYNKRFERFQAPILDAMQTLPAFCYLVPIIMVFGANKTSVILATVIYSIVPMIRLTILGLTQIPESYTEVSKSFGGTTFQTLIKIKYPMAIPNLVMGFNQTVMMAFAMQIVTPLIGGKGLGREVYQALAKSDTGKGLAAGMAICLLAIIIDRISMAVTKKQRDALGLS